MLYPGTAKTLQDYADMVFTPYVSSQLDIANRMGFIWDVYKPDILKSTAREKRNKGVRKQILSSTVIHQNRIDFMRVDDNKTELFRTLA